MGLHVGRLCPALIAFSLILTVKKKCSTGLKLSNLMNLGRKKSTSLEPPERSLETSSKTRGNHQGPGLLHCVAPVLEGEPTQRKPRMLESTQSWGLGLSALGCSLCFTRFCPATVLGPLRK